tara:strand:+ start:1097 stop:1267 length:171 start_codon:yes stop_codon:yes gene_type:complete
MVPFVIALPYASNMGAGKAHDPLKKSSSLLISEIEMAFGESMTKNCNSAKASNHET